LHADGGEIPDADLKHLRDVAGATPSSIRGWRATLSPSTTTRSRTGARRTRDRVTWRSAGR